MDHDHELLKPQVISTWMPNGVGSMPGKRVIFAETQVSIFDNYHHTTISIQYGVIIKSLAFTTLLVSICMHACMYDVCNV